MKGFRGLELMVYIYKMLIIKDKKLVEYFIKHL